MPEPMSAILLRAISLFLCEYNRSGGARRRRPMPQSHRPKAKKWQRVIFGVAFSIV
jgi:hypothetical protein